MIKITNLSIYKKNNLVLNNISAELQGKVAIIGANNTGKTKFIKAICGRTKIESGNIEISEEFVLEHNLNTKNKGFMYVPKNYSTFMGDLKVKHIISFFTKGKEYNLKLLKDKGILENLKFKELTFIQKLILFIDIGLKKQKNIFLFDEPLLFLDMYERIQFKQVINTYLNKSIVILTTNNLEPEVLRGFDQKYYIHAGQLKKNNPLNATM